MAEHERTGAGDREEWDARYGDHHQVWSGRPNGSLVAEVAGLPPGTALEVACGEGADAIWLAARGWSVTATDVSEVAVTRARRAAEEAGADIRWDCRDLVADGPPDGRFDLVTCMYPALRRTADDRVIAGLLGAVAPGGTLLFVHHAHEHDAAHGHEATFDPADYVQPADVASRLGDGWVVVANDERPRPDAPADARHLVDVVLVARRSS